MAVPAIAEARSHRRNRILKGAVILTGVKNSEIRCTIRNMHEHGAELKIDPQSLVPRSFLVYVPTDAIAYQAELRWRRHDRVGIRITGTEARPHWHFDSLA